MRHHERRELLVIEKNLLVDAPELATLFDPLSQPARSRRGRRAALWLEACLLRLAALLDDMTVLLGALVLLTMSVVRWTVEPANADEPGRRRP